MDHLINYPILDSAVNDACDVFVSGTYDGAPNTDVTLRVFSSDSCDTYGRGRADVYHGSINVTTDGTGAAYFNSCFEGETARADVSATATTTDGSSEFGPCVVTPTGISDGLPTRRPLQYALFPNIPNPFNPTTTISFELAEPNRTLLQVYDVSGRLVTTLVDNDMSADRHNVVWDGKNRQGAAVSSGVY